MPTHAAGTHAWTTAAGCQHFPMRNKCFPKLSKSTGPAGQSGFNACVYNDSLPPVIEADQARIWQGRVAGLLIEPTPGHSSGHVVFRLQSLGEEAMFSSDIMHQPIQIYRPDGIQRSASSGISRKRHARYRTAACGSSRLAPRKMWRETSPDLVDLARPGPALDLSSPEQPCPPRQTRRNENGRTN
jgi:glyoxylase-like metal-dependent hydrolase (beta-lactamase superfamily II)